MSKVKVISGVCGMGKTHYIRQHIKELTKGKKKFTISDDKVLFASPLRSEVFEMAGVKCMIDKNQVYQPSLKKGKIDYSDNTHSFLFQSNIFQTTEYKIGANKFVNGAIKRNENVAITHKALEYLSDETIELLKEYNYHLLIDETPAAIQDYSKVKSEELLTMINHKILSYNKGTKRVNWNLKNNESLERYDDFKKFLETGDCFLNYEDKTEKPVSIIKEIRTSLFSKPKSTTVFTYLLKGTYFYYWLKRHKIRYDSPDWTREKILHNDRIVDYHLLININGEGSNRPFTCSKHILSSTWHKNVINNLEEGYEEDSINESLFSEIATKLTSFFNNKRTVNLNAEGREFFEKELQSLKSDLAFFEAYIPGNRTTSEELSRYEHIQKYYPNSTLKERVKKVTDILTPEVINEENGVIEKLWSTFKSAKEPILSEQGSKVTFTSDHFITFNLKAVNTYRQVKRMAHTVNVFPVVNIKNYLIRGDLYRKVGLEKGEFDDDAFATHELIQWLFRSRIRDGKKIDVLILSSRMKKLLEEWRKEFSIVESLAWLDSVKSSEESGIVKSLSVRFRKFSSLHEHLPLEFSNNTAIEIGSKFDLSESEVKSYLQKQLGKKYKYKDILYYKL